MKCRTGCGAEAATFALELCTVCLDAWVRSPEREGAEWREKVDEYPRYAHAFVDFVTRTRLEREHGYRPA